MKGFGSNNKTKKKDIFSVIKKLNDNTYNFLPFLKNDPFYCLIANKE